MGLCKIAWQIAKEEVGYSKTYEIAKTKKTKEPAEEKEQAIKLYHGYFQLFTRNICPLVSMFDAIKACRGHLEEWNILKDANRSNPVSDKDKARKTLVIRKLPTILFGRAWAGLTHLGVAGVGVAMALGFTPLSMGLPIIFGAIGLGLLVSFVIHSYLSQQPGKTLSLLSRLALGVSFVTALGVTLACAIKASLAGITFIKAFIFLASVCLFPSAWWALGACLAVVGIGLIIARCLQAAQEARDAASDLSSGPAQSSASQTSSQSKRPQGPDHPSSVSQTSSQSETSRG